MVQKTRTELQELFKTGAKPSQQDFTDFIESTLNRKDDGIEKPSGAGVPLKIMAQGDDEKLLDFYKSETKTWSISQKSGDEEGLNISNSSGESKLFIDSSSGDVGIGTTTPEAKLSVNGGLHVGGTSDPGDNNLEVDGTTTTSGLSVLGNLYFATGSRQKINLHQESYGIGIQTETQYFRSLKNFAWYKDGSHHNSELNPGGGTVQMVIKENGNVGIGTASPEGKLDVRGALKVNGSLNVNHSSVDIGGEFGTTTLTIRATNAAANPGRTTCINLIGYENRGKGLYFSDTGSNEKWFIGTGYFSREFSIGYSATGAETDYKENAKFFVHTNGNVGIGTESPGAKLSINGGLHVGGTSNPGDNNLEVDGTTTTSGLSVSGSLSFSNDTLQKINLHAELYGIGIQSYTQYFRTLKNFAWYKDGSHHNSELNPGGGTVQMVIKDGNVGIGTPTPGAKLEVNGDLKVEGKFIGDLNIKDTRDDNEAPNAFDKVVSFDFKRRTTVGVPGGGKYSGMLTIAPWDNDSGDAHHQLNFNEGGIFWRQGQPDATTWEDWYRIANDGMTDNFSFMGNVGIGTTSPGAKLSINGGLHVGGTSNPGDNNLEVDGTTTTSGLSVLGNLYFATGSRQKINLHQESYGIGIQSETQYFRSLKNFAWYKGGSHHDNTLNPGGGTVQMVIKENGNVGIGTASPSTKLEVNGTIKAKRLQVTNTKPIQVKKYSNIGDNANYNTGYSTNDWICGIIGFYSGSGDIYEDHSGVIIRVYAYPNPNNNKWYIRSDFRTHNGGESWTIWLMAIRKDIVEAVNAL